MALVNKVSLIGTMAVIVVVAVLIAGCLNTTSPNSVQTTGTGASTGKPPIANAGADQKGKTGTVITLNGSGSSAPNGGALTYSWSLSSVPKNSSVRLANPTSDRATLTPDKAGTYVVSLTVTDGSGTKSAPATTNVTAVPAERMDTNITDIHASKMGDLYLGDQVVTTGRLVDADGNGIPNQTIEFKAVAHVLGITQDYPAGSATTDSTGAFRKVNDQVTANQAPSFIKTVTVEGWMQYAGNDVYKPTSTPHKQVTIHFTSPPTS